MGRKSKIIIFAIFFITGALLFKVFEASLPHEVQRYLNPQAISKQNVIMSELEANVVFEEKIYKAGIFPTYKYLFVAFSSNLSTEDLVSEIENLTNTKTISVGRNEYMSQFSDALLSIPSATKENDLGEYWITNSWKWTDYDSNLKIFLLELDDENFTAEYEGQDIGDNLVVFTLSKI